MNANSQPNTQPQGGPASRFLSKLPVPERLHRVVTAWAEVAPEQRFANLTLAEFQAAAQVALDQRASQAGLQATLDAKISVRHHADQATRLLIQRVVGSVVADVDFGPDSSLYEAMGYVRASAKRTRGRGSPSEPGAAGRNPRKSRGMSYDRALMERLGKVLAAWEKFAPGRVFAGMTLDQFAAKSAPSREVREELDATRVLYSAGISDSAKADAKAAKLIKRVIWDLRCQEEFGDDCPLYRALGYRCASERRSPKRPSSLAAGTRTTESSVPAFKPLAAQSPELNQEATAQAGYGPGQGEVASGFPLVAL